MKLGREQEYERFKKQSEQDEADLTKANTKADLLAKELKTSKGELEETRAVLKKLREDQSTLVEEVNEKHRQQLLQSKEEVERCRAEIKQLRTELGRAREETKQCKEESGQFHLYCAYSAITSSLIDLWCCSSIRRPAPRARWSSRIGRNGNLSGASL
jgi:uncharacterized coiled-coil DUF342 family protein